MAIYKVVVDVDPVDDNDDRSFFFLRIRRPPRSPLFPSPPPSRSRRGPRPRPPRRSRPPPPRIARPGPPRPRRRPPPPPRHRRRAPPRTSLRSPPVAPRATTRSEEHTSELQSPCNLVCRLLLETKK